MKADDQEGKTGMNKIRRNKEVDGYVESDNLGLDADGSSEDSWYAHLNNDNDRISHNPDGEDDDRHSNEEPGSSPLMDK